MKILFVSYHFPPYNCIGAVRTGKTAKKLLELGHDVKVLAAADQGLPKTLPLEVDSTRVLYTTWFDVNFLINILGSGNKVRLNEKLKNPGVSIHHRVLSRLKKVYKQAFHRPDGQVGWFKPAVAAGRNLIDSGWLPDIIFASASPYTSLMVAKALSKYIEVPWVGELRDLWSDNHYRHSGYIDRWLEKRTLSSASALITVSELLAERLRYKYSNIPVEVISNAFDEEDFKQLDSAGKASEKITITYTGSLYEGKRDPTPIMQIIANNVRLKEKVQLNFFGSGLSWVAEMARTLDIDDVVNVFDTIPRQESLVKQASADVLLLLTWDNEKEKGILTGKLFEYIGASKPILLMGNVTDVAADVVNKNGFGLASNKDDEVRDFILCISNVSTRIRAAYGKNRYQFERLYSIKKLERILALSAKKVFREKLL